MSTDEEASYDPQTCNHPCVFCGSTLIADLQTKITALEAVTSQVATSTTTTNTPEK